MIKNSDSSSVFFIGLLCLLGFVFLLMYLESRSHSQVLIACYQALAAGAEVVCGDDG